MELAKMKPWKQVLAVAVISIATSWAVSKAVAYRDSKRTTT